MTKSLAEILDILNNICDKEKRDSKGFGVEFGTYSHKVLQGTSVKCITLSPLMNLRLTHFMNENNSNLAITILPLSIAEKNFPLSEKDFELLKSLVTNNIKTIKLPISWIYSSKGSFAYFLQTIGIKTSENSKILGIIDESITKWDLPGITFNDFLSSLNHTNKKWLAYNFCSDEKELSIVLENKEYKQREIEKLRMEGINTIVGFKLDSGKVPLYQQNKINYLYVPFIDYCNVALRKFAQILQLEINEKVVFRPSETKNWIGTQELQTKTN